MNRDHINAHVLQRTGGRVQFGPFSGMRLLPNSFWGDGDITPKLLGIYEQELHDAICQIGDGDCNAIVNIGAAEGYYAIGFALRCPAVPVFAFESDVREHPSLRKNAALNGVETRIQLRGACTAQDLISLANEHGRLFILCDCEGYEVTLFSAPGVANALRQSNILVECHDFAVPNCTPIVFARLWATHRIDIIYCGGRNPGAIPFLSNYSDQERWAAVCENRPRLMNFLVCRPK